MVEERPVDVIIRSIPIAISPVSAEIFDNMNYAAKYEFYEYFSGVFERLLIYLLRNGGLPPQ